MYFWNIESLKEDIVNGLFADKELIPYVVIYVGLYAVSIEIIGYLPYEDINVWTYVLSILNVIIPIAGTIYAYKCNGGANGTNFASKYFSIGFVVGVRFLAYLIPLMVLMIVYWVVVFSDQEELSTTILEVVLFSSWYALLYFKMANHIGDTAKA